MSKDDAVMIPLTKLKPYGRNIRKIRKSVDVVAASIAMYGFNQPIVCDMESNIIAGNTRYYAAKKLKMTEVPVIYRDFNVREGKMYRLMDNASQEHSEWNKEFLAEEIAELDDDTYTGFSENDIAKMLGTNEDKEPEDLDDMVHSYSIVIKCTDEDQQMEVFTKMNDRGYPCRILSI